MIWDPSGKDAERSFLGEEKLRANEAAIHKQIDSFLKHLMEEFGIKFDYEMVNNFDFYKDMSFLNFLSEVGKYITVNYMAAKESVKKRLTDPELSITYTEFSYMLIQGYDFCKLYQDKGVNLQLWGSDQWWNVTTGIEITRKKLDKEVYGLTIPLITDASGKKFGKSEGNAIFLSPEKNSPYFVYQYFMNTTDQDVEKYLKVLTLLSFEEIQKIVDQHKEHPEQRYGQKRLANEIVAVIFGKQATIQAEKISEILFGNGDKMELIKSMNQGELAALAKETGGCKLHAEARILELCVQTWICESNGEAKKLLQSGSIFVNETKIEDIQTTFSDADLVNWVLLVRKGKKTFNVVSK